LANTLRLTVTPHSGTNDGLMAKIYRVITDSLAREMVRNREEFQVITLQNVEALLNIRVVFGSPPDIEVLP
jgi:hypothetical protein